MLGRPNRKARSPENSQTISKVTKMDDDNETLKRHWLERTRRIQQDHLDRQNAAQRNANEEARNRPQARHDAIEKPRSVEYESGAERPRASKR